MDGGIRACTGLPAIQPGLRQAGTGSKERQTGRLEGEIREAVGMAVIIEDFFVYVPALACPF
jgi:hypothetical protein